MAIITTHPGGPYYVWRKQVTGQAPPSQFDENNGCEGILYHAWQHGTGRDQAAAQWDTCLHPPARPAPPPPPPQNVWAPPPPPAPPPNVWAAPTPTVGVDQAAAGRTAAPTPPAAPPDVARAAGPTRWFTVGATDFTGCGGYYRNLCDGKFYYAELGRVINGVHQSYGWIARALGLPGHLSPPSGLWIRYGGKTTYAELGDVGYGQGNQASGRPSDSHYAIDLHDNLASYLGFPGKADVEISPNFAVPGGAAAPQTQASVAKYVNPLAHASVRGERIDQGVDYAGTGYLVAIADGKVTQSVPNGSGWEREGYLEYVITTPGPLNNVHIYYAEGVNPVVSNGELVRAGARVADLRQPMPHGIELGFAAGVGELSYYSYHDGAYQEGTATRPGIAFDNLVRRLGGPRGVIEGAVVGKFPEYMQSGEPDPSISASATQISGITGGGGGADAPGAAARFDFPSSLYSAFVQLQRGALNGSHHSHSGWAFTQGIEYVTKAPD